MDTIIHKSEAEKRVKLASAAAQPRLNELNFDNYSLTLIERRAVSALELLNKYFASEELPCGLLEDLEPNAELRPAEMDIRGQSKRPL